MTAESPESTESVTGVVSADWLAAVRRCWQGGPMPAFADRLVELANFETAVIDLTPDAVRCLLRQVHLVVPGLQRLLDILADHDFLTRVDTHADHRADHRVDMTAQGRHLGAYRLTLAPRATSRG